MSVQGETEQQKSWRAVSMDESVFNGECAGWNRAACQYGWVSIQWGVCRVKQSSMSVWMSQYSMGSVQGEIEQHVSMDESVFNEECEGWKETSDTNSNPSDFSASKERWILIRVKHKLLNHQGFWACGGSGCGGAAKHYCLGGRNDNVWLTQDSKSDEGMTCG